MNLGATIKNLRKQQGVRQGELAKACEITQAYLSKIESDLKEPNISTLKKIANELAVPLPILFFLSMDQNDVPSEKKQAFSIMAPSIKSLINQFFSMPT